MNLDELKFDEKGLIPCVTQDYRDGKVLMVAYMNKESIRITLEKEKACYFSRSRNELWLKGEESGNVQEVKEMYIDCDKDTILLKVNQIGDCACHEGYRSCFFRKYDGSDWEVVGELVQDPESMYDE
ncbi:MAG: phosphoribosyl-AMP cyclohydrolase [Elusimicrobiota bacterium]